MTSREGPRAVIFGGAGFVGTHLAEQLAGDGFDVTLADIADPVRPVPTGIRREFVDVRKPIALEVKEPALVFNLAAVHRTPGHPDNEYYDTNVAGALNVAAWCERAGARKLAFASSISVYGPTEVEKDESAEPAPNSAYGRSKLLAERIHEDWQARGDRTLIIARPAVVFGPGEHGNFTRLAQALKRGRFFYPGRDDTVKACGYVTDLVRALLFGLDETSTQWTFNYCYPRNYTIREICEAFEDVAGYAAPRTAPVSLVNAAVTGLRHLPGSRASGALNPDRIQKLTASTNIAPAALQQSGFIWDTDLNAALRRWLAADPRGEFV